jgi:hypothetical protein
MKEKDIDNVLDIPNIERFINEFFTLNIYDAGDRVLYYEYKAPLNGDSCDIAISLDKEPKLIEGKTKFSDLLILDDIGMIEVKTGLKSEPIYNEEMGFFMSDFTDLKQNYWYRPFLKTEEKNY